MSNSISRLIVVSAVICAASPAWAQSAPAWSRGIQALSIDVGECSSRAQSALQAEGYSVTQVSAAGEDGYFVGRKDPHSAVIMCDRSANGGTWVNIVVASNAGDGGVPGFQRQRLQARMDNAAQGSDRLDGNWVGTSGAGGLREEWSITNYNGQWNVAGKWFRGDVEVGNFRGVNYGYQNGHLSFTQIMDRVPIDGWKSGTRIEAWANGDTMTFRWTGVDGSGGTATARRK